MNLLARHMHRGLAIGLSYLALLLIPVLLALILVPPIVNGVDDLAVKAPDYAAQAQDYVQKNKTLRKLEDDYGVITQLEEQAKKLPQKLGTAAGTLTNIGLGVVNSIFAGVTILILSIFMVVDGRRWVIKALALQPAERAARLDRALSGISTAVANYVGGAAGPGDDRRPDELHRHGDPRDPVRGAAGRPRRLRRPHPAGGRHDRRRAGRHRHALRRLPDRHRSSG